MEWNNIRPETIKNISNQATKLVDAVTKALDG